MLVVCNYCGKQFIFEGGTDTKTYRVCKLCRAKGSK